MELEERYSHTYLTFLPAGIEAVVDGLYHIFRHTAAIVYDLDGKQVFHDAVFHLNGYLGGTGTDGIVGDVYYMKVQAFHITK